MIKIQKNKIPNCLINAKQKYKNYNEFKLKDELRKCLFEEQGGICCYCTRKLNLNKTKIEHFLPQSKNPESDLHYNNLFLACEGKLPKSKILYEYLCDTEKGDQKLSNALRPSEVDELKVSYGRNGSIHHSNCNITEELNEVLNLNNQKLKNERQKALEGFQNFINQNSKNKKKVNQQMYRYLNMIDDQLPEYTGLIRYYIKKHNLQTL